MATWPELKQYIGTEYKVSEDIGRGVKLIFDVGDGRAQSVFITNYQLMDGDEEWVVVESPIGQIGIASLDTAAREVGAMVVGGVAISTEFGDPIITLRHAIPLANLDINEFERPLRLVTTSADRLEGALTGADRH